MAELSDADLDAAQKLADNLARLADMHAQGHLSDAQYEKAKDVLIERVAGTPLTREPLSRERAAPPAQPAHAAQPEQAAQPAQPAPRTDRPVWTVDRVIWRCVEHRTPRCAACSEVVAPPTSPGREGDVYPGGDWQPTPDPDWTAVVAATAATAAPEPTVRGRRRRKR